VVMELSKLLIDIYIYISIKSLLSSITTYNRVSSYTSTTIEVNIHLKQYNNKYQNKIKTYYHVLYMNENISDNIV